MTLRRRTPLQARRATQTPEERRARQEVRERDQGRCIGPRAGFPGDCYGESQYDHIRASGGLGIKSEWAARNGATLCLTHHDWKTNHGREGRALLIAYLLTAPVGPGGEQ